MLETPPTAAPTAPTAGSCKLGPGHAEVFLERHRPQDSIFPAPCPQRPSLPSLVAIQTGASLLLTAHSTPLPLSESCAPTPSTLEINGY
mmetsp:Transcript_119493/g.208044  ORF Transcript_119493/g.208044 Transcript_119493/m.208044 type:complete len:89 (+) Transcript_119493:431-697(+)